MNFYKLFKIINIDWHEIILFYENKVVCNTSVVTEKKFLAWEIGSIATVKTIVKNFQIKLNGYILFYPSVYK